MSQKTSNHIEDEIKDIFTTTIVTEPVRKDKNVVNNISDSGLNNNSELPKDNKNLKENMKKTHSLFSCSLNFAIFIR